MRNAFPRIDLDATICAIATPPGQGGLGIIRVSGPNAIALTDRIFRGQSALLDCPGYTVHHGFIHDPASGMPVDEVLVTLFRAPRSYSGEDLVEISTHGGGVVLGRVLRALTDSGASPATPGEFTLRAFLNGRIDLTEAEAVGDLIAAKTEASAQAAITQLRGGLHEKVAFLRTSLTAVLARLEMGIDFTEEDLPVEETSSLAKRLENLKGEIAALLAGYARGRILRDGFQVVLAGPPNVGKSTLFNRLAQDDRAIVTDIPGTTRDILREYINLDGWPLCILDTAGLRDSLDTVERIGIGKTSEAIVRADGVIWIVDATRMPEDQLPPETVTNNSTPYLIVVNKVDALSSAADTDAILKRVGQSEPMHSVGPAPLLPISAIGGQGIEELLRVVAGWISTADASAREGAIAINDRHRAALTSAQAGVERALSALASGAELEIIAFEAKTASTTLGEIIGETTTDEILGEIFANFCVGK